MKDLNDFKFYVPLDTISKGQNAIGKEVYKFKGVASTRDRDSDGEFLDPEGFDLSYLISKGFVNYNHVQLSNPAAIIGEPTKAEIRNGELYLEADLYPWSPIAKAVYELAENLEKSGSDRRLGWSIEGKAIKRKSDDKNHPDYKHVLRAAITGVAITAMPKNGKTFADIMKGEFFENEELIYETSPEEVDKLIKSNILSAYIVDITKNGKRLLIDENLNVRIFDCHSNGEPINIEKSEELEDEEGEDDTEDNIMKDMSTTSGASESGTSSNPLIRSSLEGDNRFKKEGNKVKEEALKYATILKKAIEKGDLKNYDIVSLKLKVKGILENL